MIVTRLKQAGVTTVILFTDVAMTRSLMENATKQEWSPEWFFTGHRVPGPRAPRPRRILDRAVVARVRHLERVAMGAARPGVGRDSATALKERLDWYWGPGVGTVGQLAAAADQLWLLAGINAAGPKLTPKTFQQGLFSVPGVRVAPRRTTRPEP